METGCGSYEDFLQAPTPTDEELRKRLRLVFDTTQSQPDFASLFLQSGGSITTAAGQGETDMSLTGGSQCAHAFLSSVDATEIHIPIADAMVASVDGSKVVINADLKLNVNSNRMGMAINGVVGSTHAGSGCVYVSNLLTHKSSHVQVPCTYGNLMSHSCTIGLSNIKVLNGLDEQIDIEFKKSDELHDVMAAAESAVDEWANGAWNLRKSIRYAASPTLTKSVAQVPVGINASGYSLVHDVIDQPFPFSMTTLNSLLEASIGMELGFDEENISQMMQSTNKPGLRAAVWGQTVAAATSTLVNFLMSYRADGRTVLNQKGSEFVAIESWLLHPMRTADCLNDCDGSGILGKAAIEACIDANDEDLAKLPYVQAVKNVVHPYYQVGVTVVGATAAQANAADVKAQSIAGHALSLMVPTLAFLDGLHEAAAHHTVAGKSLTRNASELQRLRHEAIFTEAVLHTLPEEEASKLRNLQIADWENAKRLQPYAIEGTTPSSPVLYVPDSFKRAAVAADAKRDSTAFSKASPNVARGLKVLHAGSHDKHVFYSAVCELSFHARNPLYTDIKLREAGHAASQFVFANPNSRDLTEAGTTPKQLVLSDFAVVPMHTIDQTKGHALDVAGAAARMDMIPPRSKGMVLTTTQSSNLQRSLKSLRVLDESLPNEHDTGHCVAYLMTYGTLINNPQSVEHFTSRLKQTSVAGVVDFVPIRGLATDADGEEAGHFVAINAVVAI
jgi:hypothetical protein